MINPTDSPETIARKQRIQSAVAGYYQKQYTTGIDEVRAEAEREARPKRKRPENANPLEHEEQRVVVDWLKAHNLTYAANLEGAYYGGTAKDRAIRGAVQRRAGAKAGRPDLEVFSPCPRFPNARGVALEMKSLTGKASPEQLAYLDALSGCGWVTYVAHGATDAIEWLKTLGFGQ